MATRRAVCPLHDVGELVQRGSWVLPIVRVMEGEVEDLPDGVLCCTQTNIVSAGVREEVSSSRRARTEVDDPAARLAMLGRGGEGQLGREGEGGRCDRREEGCKSDHGCCCCCCCVAPGRGARSRRASVSCVGDLQRSAQSAAAEGKRKWAETRLQASSESDRRAHEPHPASCLLAA